MRGRDLRDGRVRNERLLVRILDRSGPTNRYYIPPWSHNLPRLPEIAPVVPASLHYWAASLSAWQLRYRRPAFGRVRRFFHVTRVQFTRKTSTNRSPPTFPIIELSAPAPIIYDLHTTERRGPNVNEKRRPTGRTRLRKDINAPSPSVLPMTSRQFPIKTSISR